MYCKHPNKFLSVAKLIHLKLPTLLCFYTLLAKSSCFESLPAAPYPQFIFFPPSLSCFIKADVIQAGEMERRCSSPYNSENLI